MNRLATLCTIGLALVGSITLTYPNGTQTATAEQVEVRFGALISGSTAGADYSDAAASTAGALISVRRDVLYLNNTNATGVWYAKVSAVSTIGISNIVSLTVGLDNGTASVGQVIGTLGALTQLEGSYVRLEPASTNKIYLTQAVSLLGPDTRLTLDVYAADSPTADAYVITNANLTIT